MQLALAVLSVLLGRRITPDDYPKNLDGLLDEFARTSGKRSPTLAGPLRRWLEEALDPAAGFETAVDAGESLLAPGVSGRADRHRRTSDHRTNASVAGAEHHRTRDQGH